MTSERSQAQPNQQGLARPAGGLQGGCIAEHLVKGGLLCCICQQICCSEPYLPSIRLSWAPYSPVVMKHQHQRTLQALFDHPIQHNLRTDAVEALLEQLGASAVGCCSFVPPLARNAPTSMGRGSCGCATGYSRRASRPTIPTPSPPRPPGATRHGDC